MNGYIDLDGTGDRAPTVAEMNDVRSAMSASGIALSSELNVPRRSTTVMSSPPTITYSASAPTEGRAMLMGRENAQILGGVGAYSNVHGAYNLDGTTQQLRGCEVLHYGTAITFGYRRASGDAEKFMYYVDGQPAIAAPEASSLTTVAGTTYYVTLTFGSAALRRIEFLGTSFNQLGRIVVGLQDEVKATTPRRKVMIVGDSFNEDSAAIDSIQSPPNLLLMRMELNICNNSLGGTGYVNDGGGVTKSVFGSAERVARAAAFRPDDILFMGSVNDTALSGVGAAAAAAYASYRAACPKARFIVFGVQPSNATDTLSANTSTTNKAIAAAAVAAGAIFYDMIGNAFADPVGAYVNATVYNPGELVTYVGSIWRYDSDTAAAHGSNFPGKYSQVAFTLMTMDLYGTGRVGAVANNGSRDTLLYSDSAHPTAPACEALSRRQENALIRYS